MRADQVLELLDLLATGGVPAVVDGGWGVDALIGRATRPHGDLDLVVAHAELGRVRELLAAAGFEVVRDWLPTALALRHPDGREVDLHPVEPTPDGGGDQVQRDGSRWHYEAPTSGLIGGRTLRCCTLATQLAAHLGYEPGPGDRADMAALSRCFAVELPEPYRPA